MILVTYGIDQALYDDPRSIHNIVATTTIYSCKTKKLVRLQFGKLLQNKLENRLSGNWVSGEQYLFEDESGSIEPLTQDQFQEKFKQFDPKHTVKEQEILESYCYKNNRNQQEVVQIAITRKDDYVEAVIDFENAAQYENFLQPAWLICL